MTSIMPGASLDDADIPAIPAVGKQPMQVADSTVMSVRKMPCGTKEICRSALYGCQDSTTVLNSRLLYCQLGWTVDSQLAPHDFATQTLVDVPPPLAAEHFDEQQTSPAFGVLTRLSTHRR